MKTKKLVSIFLCVALMLALSIPAFAANIAYSFNLRNTGTSFSTYTSNYNTKSYLSDPATIKCDSTDAPGYGYYMHLAYKSGLSYIKATDSYWYNTNSYLLHPSYLSGAAVLNRAYYIQGRIDNDYSGPYAISGVFNSDWTNP